MKKVLLLFLVIGFLACSVVSAQSSIYRVDGQHSGVWVALNRDGTGSVYDASHSIQFKWTPDHVAHYWFWSVPFNVTDSKLTSPDFPDDVGILVVTGS
jgi:hypothetical protein